MNLLGDLFACFGFKRWLAYELQRRQRLCKHFYLIDHTKKKVLPRYLEIVLFFSLTWPLVLSH